MNVNIPDHYVANVGGAMVERAVDVINANNIVPAYLHQFADLWDNHGVRFGGSDVNFWTAVFQAGAKSHVLTKAGLL